MSLKCIDVAKIWTYHLTIAFEQFCVLLVFICHVDFI